MITLKEAISIIEKDQNAKVIDGIETEDYYIFHLDTDLQYPSRYAININTGLIEKLNVLQITGALNTNHKPIEL